MKHSNTIGKTKVLNAVRAAGLTMERKTVNGSRKWVLSNGKQFDTLAQVAQEMKV